MLPHAINCKNDTELTEFFTSLRVLVDRFHYPGHKSSDEFCSSNCNPNDMMKTLGIKHVNSVACEQAFSWINKYTQLKSMNEARFRMFLIYMVDCHNMKIQNHLHITANPISKKRTLKPDRKKLQKNVSVAEVDLRNIIKKVETLKVSEEISSDCVYGYLEDFSSESDGILKCKFCPACYKKKEILKTHLEEKHGKKIVLRCAKCGSDEFENQNKLTRHEKTCS